MCFEIYPEDGYIFDPPASTSVNSVESGHNLNLHQDTVNDISIMVPDETEDQY